MDRDEAQALSNLTADVFGIDRTVPRGAAEVRLGYKKIQGGYSIDGGFGKSRTAGLVIFVPERLGDLPTDVPRHPSGTRNVLVPHPDDDALALDAASEAWLVADAIKKYGVSCKPPWRVQSDRIDAWAARWLAARYPAFEQEIATYRTPAKRYAESWEWLMPDLQAWLRRSIHVRDRFWRAFAPRMARKLPPERRVHPGDFWIYFAHATPEDVCNAVVAAAAELSA